MRRTSHEARESIDSASLERAVLTAITEQNGLTCDEAQDRLNLSHQSCSPRFSALSRAGRIIDSGERRCTRSGRKAIVWMPADQATLFDDRAKSISELKDDVIRCACIARDSGNWYQFQISLGLLTARKGRGHEIDS